MPWLGLGFSSQGRHPSPARADYLGEGIHTAPRLKQQLHTVGADAFSRRVQGSQTFLKHRGEYEDGREAEARP